MPVRGSLLLAQGIHIMRKVSLNRAIRHYGGKHPARRSTAPTPASHFSSISEGVVGIGVLLRYNILLCTFRCWDIWLATFEFQPFLAILFTRGIGGILGYIECLKACLWILVR